MGESQQHCLVSVDRLVHSLGAAHEHAGSWPGRLRLRWAETTNLKIIMAQISPPLASGYTNWPNSLLAHHGALPPFPFPPLIDHHGEGSPRRRAIVIKSYAADQREGARCGGLGLPVAAGTRPCKPAYAWGDHPVERGAGGTLTVSAVRRAAVQEGEEDERD